MNFLRILMQPVIDVTRLGIEWNRYWLDHVEHVADEIDGYGV